MLRLAPHRQALRLRSFSGVRGYATPAANDASSPQGNAERKTGFIPGRIHVPVEGSLSRALYEETDSGKTAFQELQAKVSELAVKRRAARLAREAAQKDSTAASANGEPSKAVPSRRPHAQRRPGHEVDLDQLTSTSGPPQGQFQRRNRQGGQGDRRRPQRDGSRYQMQAKPKPRVLTSNAPPAAKAATEQTASEQEEAQLVCSLEQPNTTGPVPVLREFTSLLWSKDAVLDKALSKLSPGNPVLAAQILRRFGGDYSFSVPPQSPETYTTPINKLPIATQLALASAKAKSLEPPSRKLLLETVTKSVGAVARA